MATSLTLNCDCQQTLVWQLAANGGIKASLRAAGNVDVAAIAGRYGGSRHPNAAGFRMPAADFLAKEPGK
jgi:nanoRNase/pAp phosphatase (c-di-AMP/oligoRNAs hydrolase)